MIAWFVILLLVVWVGGTWMAPFGPRLWDVAWLPFLIRGVDWIGLPEDWSAEASDELEHRINDDQRVVT
jgi:hypothetical protein